jgi:hypothetical protein
MEPTPAVYRLSRVGRSTRRRAGARLRRSTPLVRSAALPELSRTRSTAEQVSACWPRGRSGGARHIRLTPAVRRTDDRRPRRPCRAAPWLPRSSPAVARELGQREQVGATRALGDRQPVWAQQVIGAQVPIGGETERCSTRPRHGSAAAQTPAG